MNIPVFIMFFLIVSTVYCLLNLFVYFSISKGILLSRTYKRILCAAFLVLSPLYIISEIPGIYIINVHIIRFAGAVWIGILSISFTVFLLQLIIMTINRNRYRKQATIISLFLIFAISLVSIYRGIRFPKLVEIDIYSDKIPESLSGFTAIQIADLHIGNIKSVKWFRSIIKHISGMSPDIVLITGDLIDMDICSDNQICNILADLKSANGIAAVYGNHEYYAGIHNLDEMEQLENFNLLVNQSLSINRHINIIGLDDPTAMRFNKKGPDIAKATEDIDKDAFNILLVHQPVNLDYYSTYNIDLILCGHTHSGQIPPMDLIVQLIFKYTYGFYSTEDADIYVTSGTGIWGPPMRLFSNSEIVRIRLFQKKKTR